MAEAKFTNRAARYQRRVKEPGRQVRRGPTAHYIWRINPEDVPRTRSGHRRLNGGMFNWDDPPVVDSTTGERGHPGLDKYCRCWAEPVPDEELGRGGAEAGRERQSPSPAPVPAADAETGGGPLPEE